MWRSAVEIEEQLEALEQSERAKLSTLYALNSFWDHAAFTEGYKADEEWTSLLALTPYGKEVLVDLQPNLNGLTQADTSLGLFLKFCHEDLLVDWRNSETAQIRRLLERELLQASIRLPYRFGRLLYDRFNDNYTGNRTEHLMASDVEQLLRGTPIGVYQLGNLVSGPLGIIDSHETRYIPISTDLSLWHCSDTGCSALHKVKLVQPRVPALDARSRILAALSKREGPASEWRKALSWGLRDDRARPYVDLPAVIADCIIGSERTALLAAALRTGHGHGLRQVLALPPRRKRDSEGPADVLASRLGPESQLHLLLMLPDRALVDLIDQQVQSKAIRVPLGEMRSVAYSLSRWPKDSESEVSALGIRSARPSPMVNLTSAIWRAYERLNLSTELVWRVKGDPSKPSYEALVAFVRSHGPAACIRDLILSSAAVTKALCEDLRVPLDFARASEDVSVDRMLWKFGFNPMQFEDSFKRFKARLSELNEAILANTPIATEDARERVREKGVNVFVSLEDFIDRLISYNLWLLSSDHFIVTKFEYSSLDARRSVASHLGEVLQSGDETTRWNVAGENSLGVLLRYLRAAAEWIRGLPDQDRDSLKRPTEDLPHFAEDERRKFPFNHVSLWADSDPGELRKHADSFARVVRLIEESLPASVRNGLDHFRESESFPSVDRLLACVARLREAVEIADASRLVPKTYWLSRMSSDRFGAMELEFRDYAGRPTISFGPALVSGLKLASFDEGYVLAPGNLLGLPNASLVFKVREPSEFSTYWQGYPRRRRLPVPGGSHSSGHEGEPGGVTASAPTSDPGGSEPHAAD